MPLPCGLLHLGQPTFQSCLHQGSDLSVIQGLFLQKRGSSLFPDTPTMHCKILGSGIGVPAGTGQSLVGLLLSDGTVRQGLDTSRQGTGAGEGKEEKEKGGREQEGRLGYNCHCYQGPAFLGSLGQMWKGEKRQLKPVGVGPVPHPHPGQRGQLYPLCWTRWDWVPRAPWGALASRPWGLGTGPPLVALHAYLSRQGRLCTSGRDPHMLFSLTLLVLHQSLWVHCLPFSGMSGLGNPKSQNLCSCPE